MPESFPKRDRITSKPDFDRVFRQGKKRTGSFVCLHYIISTEDHTRVGITVSKKVDLRAVVRNLIKRRLRDIFRRNRQLFPDCLDIVIRALPQCAHAQYGELRDEVFKLAEMAGREASRHNADKTV